MEVYVTMSPKAKASTATLAQRRQGFKDAAAFGSHAAHHALANPPGPPSHGPDKFRVVPKAALGQAGLALIG